MTEPWSDSNARAVLRRPWRRLFIAYFILLEVGTHWPRLELPGQIPATDKTIHFVAFGILTILLALTGWIRSRLAVVAAAATIAVVDEFSQAIPGLGRTVSSLDIFANLTGVASAALWLWTSSPVGSRANVLRQRRYEAIAWRTTAERDFWWRVFAPAPLLGIMVAILWMTTDADVTQLAIRGSMIFGVLWFGGVLLARRLPFLRTVEHARPCYSCGASIPQSSSTYGSCTHCTSEWDIDQWRGWNKPELAEQRRIMLPSIIGGAVLFLIAIGVISIVFRLQSVTASAGPFEGILTFISDTAKRVCRWPSSIGRIADLAFLNLVFTTMFRIYRVRLGRWYDRAQRCESCGHDLTGTPIEDDATVCCPECGHSATVPERRTE